VDDEDLIAIARGFDVYARNNHIANVANAGVRSRVNLEYIHRSPFSDLATRGARGGIDDRAVSGGWLVRLVAIQRARDEPGGGRFSNDARAGRKIRGME